MPSPDVSTQSHHPSHRFAKEGVCELLVTCRGGERGCFGGDHGELTKMRTTYVTLISTCTDRISFSGKTEACPTSSRRSRARLWHGGCPFGKRGRSFKDGLPACPPEGGCRDSSRVSASSQLPVQQWLAAGLAGWLQVWSGLVWSGTVIYSVCCVSGTNCHAGLSVATPVTSPSVQAARHRL